MIGGIICLTIIVIWVYRFIAANPQMSTGSMFWGILWRILVVYVIYFIVTLIISGTAIGIFALANKNK